MCLFEIVIVFIHVPECSMFLVLRRPFYLCLRLRCLTETNFPALSEYTVNYLEKSKARHTLGDESQGLIP